MKVSLIQMCSESDKARNIAKAEALMQQAIDADRPDLVILPEHFDWSGGTVEQKVASGEAERGGPAWELCHRIAQRHGVFVLGGSFFEKVPGEVRVYNTSVMFDRRGNEIARYRKIHLFDIVTPDGMTYRESASVKAGTETVVVDVEGYRVGMAICYDLRFPELFQSLMKAGADLITLPSAFTTQTGKDHWEALCRARAIETECYFAAPGQYGTFLQEGEKRYNYGHSLIADPWGHVIAKASDGEGFVTARISKAEIARVRGQIPLLSHKVL